MKYMKIRCSLIKYLFARSDIPIKPCILNKGFVNLTVYDGLVLSMVGDKIWVVEYRLNSFKSLISSHFIFLTTKICSA